MNFSYEESKQCCMYHFKCKVYINRKMYKQLYEKDKTMLKTQIYQDVKEIFNKMMILNIDYEIDWKLQDYINAVKDITAQ